LIGEGFDSFRNFDGMAENKKNQKSKKKVILIRMDVYEIQFFLLIPREQCLFLVLHIEMDRKEKNHKFQVENKKIKRAKKKSDID